MSKKCKGDTISHSVSYGSGFGTFFKILLCVAIFVFVTIFLLGCAPSDRESVRTVRDYRQVEIVQINPPKRFYVKYRIVGKDKVYQLYSKHCSDWRRVKVGNVYTADVSKRSACEFVRSIK